MGGFWTLTKKYLELSEIGFPTWIYGFSSMNNQDYDGDIAISENYEDISQGRYSSPFFLMAVIVNVLMLTISHQVLV